ncbi:hypothetical protein At12D13_48430 (plasmid) [Agrobacterium fabrum]|nr:hypothetical protein At12D13_48430 [Agrobacterium fabrum]
MSAYVSLVIIKKSFSNNMEDPSKISLDDN